MATTDSFATAWIAHGTTRKHPKARLFCLPCAGGSASSYRQWPSLFPESVEVCPVQLPGREGRTGEPLLNDLLELTEELGTALEPYLNIPFALFGHSLGGLLAFELARDLRKHGYRCEHLFVAGTPAPHRPRNRAPVHQLPDDELLEYLRNLGGTPDAVLEKEWLVRMHLPILRADMACLERYVYGREAGLSVPITVFGALKDAQVDQPDLEAWVDETDGQVDVEWYEGGHFFVQDAAPQVVTSILERTGWSS